jgi:hypothetical protein
MDTKGCVFIRRLPTTVALVWFQIRFCGICVGQSGTGSSLFLVLLLPPPALISPNAPHSLISVWSTLYILDTDTVVKQPTSNTVWKKHPFSWPSVWFIFLQRVHALQRWLWTDLTSYSLSKSANIFMLVSLLGYYSTLKMKAIYSFEN